jgi:hypothetical protein
MPLWFTALLLVVVLAAIGESIVAFRNKPPTIVLAAPETRRHLAAWPLRLLAILAVALAVLQRTAYRAARPSASVDLLTSACLVAALVLIAVSYRLAKRGHL